MLTLLLPLALVLAAGLLGFCLLRAAAWADANERPPRRELRHHGCDRERPAPYDWAAEKSA